MVRKTIPAKFMDYKVILDPLGREFYNSSGYGTILESGEIQLSMLEALYLIEKKKIIVNSARKELDFDTLLKKAKKLDKNVGIRYAVFRDLRTRGYCVKTALKFGADFRVYDRGVRPGDDHAKWVCYAVHESEASTWYEFAAKTRVAHSTKKRLLIAIVDNEDDVTYYEIKWTRP